MGFNTAVQNAMQGDSESFEYLYNSTYYDMLYLAVKYIKNEKDAEYIVNDSYMKARTNMGMLHKPEKFNSWLGCIVANTSLDYIKKKKPLVFSAVGGEDNNGESFIYEVQDDNKVYKPEKSYSKKDIKILVSEMIDSLSDEQRMCVIMYHFDGQSIKSVADSMGCSENTVKSRLYYGRKALRKEMELLGKKGYKLYAASPIPFLVFLLNEEKALPECRNIGKRAVNGGGSSVKDTNNKTDGQTERQTPPQEEAAPQQSDLKIFLGTVTGKLTAVVLAAVIVGAAAAGAAVVGSSFGEKAESDSDKSESRFKRDSDSASKRYYDEKSNGAISGTITEHTIEDTSSSDNDTDDDSRSEND